MANVSFAYLDQAFTITDTSAIAYSSDENLSATNYSYISTGGFDIDFRGSGITYSGGFPDAGTVTQIEVDPDMGRLTHEPTSRPVRIVLCRQEAADRIQTKLGRNASDGMAGGQTSGSLR